MQCLDGGLKRINVMVTNYLHKLWGHWLKCVFIIFLIYFDKLFLDFMYHAFMFSIYVMLRVSILSFLCFYWPESVIKVICTCDIIFFYILSEDEALQEGSFDQEMEVISLSLPVKTVFFICVCFFFLPCLIFCAFRKLSERSLATWTASSPSPLNISSFFLVSFPLLYSQIIVLIYITPHLASVWSVNLKLAHQQLHGSSFV